MSQEISTQGTNTGNFGVNTYVIPAIGSVGLYNLASPYNTLVDPNINYTCMAIRTIGEIIAEGNDAYSLAYKPANLPQSVYESANAVNMPIIYLVSDGGNWVYIPANYILSIPVVNGINYRNMSINVLLGLLKEDYDFSNLNTQITDLVKAVTGITPTIQPVQLSNSLQVTIAQSKEIETARQANITNDTSTYVLYMQTLAKLQTAINQIQALENYIMANKDVLNIQPTVSASNS